MPGKNWRDRLHDKRPKTPVQPTTDCSTGANLKQSDKLSIENSRPQLSEKGRKRRTYHGSRPQSPLLTPTLTSFSADGELETNQETRSDIGLEASTPRRKSGQRPKLSRYISDYLFLPNAPKAPDVFSEYWDENTPPHIEPPLDPLITLQAVRSHITSIPSTPLPTEHNSGILRVFEDYRKVREEKERQDALMRETLESYTIAEAAWATTEDRYQEEVRRLELIIAQGSPGMSTLMKARQGSVVDRKRMHRKTVTTDLPHMASEFLTPDQIDEQIRLQCQKVVFHRPSSPSGTMTALSEQFYPIRRSDEFTVGTLPDSNPNGTLSRKMKSELDLAKMTNESPPRSQAPSTYSDFSMSGTPLPDGLEPPIILAVKPGVECEAFVALRELATLVARRRGIDVTTFVAGLTALLSGTDEAYKEDKLDSEPGNDNEDTIRFIGPAKADYCTNQSPGGIPRRHQSQPHVTSDRGRYRHFSFEPGDDQIGTLHRELQQFQFNREKSPAGSQSTGSTVCQDPISDALSEGSVNKSHTPNAGTPKPSKIPTPLKGASLSRARRENSNSSLLTVTRFRLDDGREFRSGIPTAYSSGNLRQSQPTSRSSSSSNLCHAETTKLTENIGSLRVCTSAATLNAAARVSGTSSSTGSKNNSPVRPGKE